MVKSTTKKINSQVVLTELVNQKQTRIIFCNKGATIFRIFFSDKNGKRENIVMAPENLNDWLANRTFSGAIVGPLAGRYVAMGNESGLELNRPPVHFHGGTNGLDTVYWENELCEQENSVTLTYRYFDKNTFTDFSVSYTFTDENLLTMKIKASTQKETFVNPTNHIYFNLNGDPFTPVTNHLLKLNSNRLYVEDDKQLIIGDQAILAEDDRDFSNEKSLAIIKEIGGLNTTFAFKKNKSAAIFQPENGRTVTIETTLPAVVIYSFNFPQKVFHAGGRMYPKYAGLTFETQYPANDLALVKLVRGQPYYSRTSFHFSIAPIKY